MVIWYLMNLGFGRWLGLAWVVFKVDYLLLFFSRFIELKDQLRVLVDKQTGFNYSTLSLL